MPAVLPDYTGSVEEAVIEFWRTRAEQAARSREAGVLNTGLRSEVTGGRHLKALQTLLVQVFADAGIPPHLMDVKRRPIPGYFRRDKSWDLVVMVDSRVVGIIELKSIVGSNPGQNFNNRTDEALGQAIDVWTAVERGLIDTPLRPWLGYLMLIEDNSAFNHAVKPRRPVWRTDPEFESTSYATRFAIFFERMVRERLLDAACVVVGERDSGAIRFPSAALSFQSFAAGIHGRCLQFRVTNPDIHWD